MSKRTLFVIAVAFLVSPAALLVQPGTGGASNHESFTDFEPAGFAVGETVHNHQPDGNEANPEISGVNPDTQAWSVRQAGIDEEIVDLGLADPEHGKVWRLSDTDDTGNLQLRPHAPKYLGFSGESSAIDDFGTEAVTSETYFASLEFRSATGAAQPGLVIDVTPACGDDCRHGYVRIVDDEPNGFDLVFFETGAGGFGEFLTIDIDLDLAYGDWHTLEIAITFIDDQNLDGTGNDIVDVYVNDELVHTGTSWETGYRISTASVRGVDRLAFSRASEGQAPPGGGLYFDNLLITDEIPPTFSVGPSTFTLCVSVFTGQVTSPAGDECGPFQIELETPSDTPLDFCVQNFTQSVTYSFGNPCGPYTQTHTVPDDGDLLTCVSVFTTQHRRVFDHDQCTRFEVPNVIEAGSGSTPSQPPPSR